MSEPCRHDAQESDPINAHVAAAYEAHPEWWAHKPCAREHEPGLVCVRREAHDAQDGGDVAAGDVEIHNPSVHVLTDTELARVRAADQERLARVEALPDAWGFGDEDSGIEHVGTCQDYGCKDCVVIACATDIRAALAAPHDGGNGT